MCMKWKKYTIKTTTAAEDFISMMLSEIGIEGIEIEDKVPLTQEELECLSIPSGTLTRGEREIIQSHASCTIQYLKKMNFDKRYPHIIEWAGAHHELLDGSGYPYGLKGDEIPFEARILTVVDIFEALTSSDRPYRKSMKREKAVGVLTEMADEGKLDREVLELFKEVLEENKGQIQLVNRYDGQDTVQ